MLVLFILLASGCRQSDKAQDLQTITTSQNHSSDLSRVDSLLALSKSAFKPQQPSTPAALDKSHHLALQALALSKKLGYQKGIAQSQLQLAVVLQEKKNYQLGKVYAALAVNSFQKIADPDQLGEAWVMYWSTNVLTGMPLDQRPPLLQKAADAFHQSANKKREGDCYREMGDIYHITGDAAKGMDVLKKALQLYREAHYERLAYVYDLIGSTYCYLGDYKEGIEYYFLAEKNAIAFGEDEFLCTVYNRIGIAYIEMADIDNCLLYYKKSLDVAIRFQNMENIGMLVENYAGALVKRNRTREALAFVNTYVEKYPALLESTSMAWDGIMVKIYHSLGKPELAKRYLPSIEKRLQTAQGYDELLLGYHLLQEASLANRDFKRFEKYHTLFGEFCQKLDKKVFTAEYYHFGYLRDSIQGNCDSALKNFHKYVILRRQNFNSAKAHEINQLNILYETEKKNKDISLLKNEAVNQKIKLEKAALTRNIMYGTVFFLAVIIFLLYKGFRIKKRSNQALQVKQEEITSKNQSLEKVIKEKEWLLREIHHRVKNNLHMVVGLLASQTEFLKGKEAVDAIAESQRRVEAMAMIHQKLYQSENLSMIDMPSYIVELTSYLKSSINNENIRFALDVEKIQFPISHSIPIGLILNEAITNALKYAFPDNQPGIIRIVLKKLQDDAFSLTISDNGIGLPEDFDLQQTHTLGLQLIQGLSDDIQAELKITSAQGTKIEMHFSIPDPDIANPILN
ncbi:histidine kinase dimerization/phosphoacceptor domain -containing protein [Flavobacterium sp.]|uniref:tetratricopeptide repeat-containing sensor histidine kinase n=1 Tax=Flavobacterium sp. TaxID=239 RepID=UPI0039E65F30